MEYEISPSYHSALPFLPIFRISGTAIMFGWDGILVEGLIFHQNGAPVMALGIQFQKIRLDEIVKKMFDKDLLRATWLANLDLGK